MRYDIELSKFKIMGKCDKCKKEKYEEMYKCKRWLMVDTSNNNIGVGRQELKVLCSECCKNENEVKEYLNGGKNG